MNPFKLFLSGCSSLLIIPLVLGVWGLDRQMSWAQPAEALAELTPMSDTRPTRLKPTTVRFTLSDGSGTLDATADKTAADVSSPVIEAAQFFAYAEGRPAGYVIGTVAATDDVGITGFAIDSVAGSNGVSYTAEGWFAISSAGVLSLTAAGAGAVASNSISTAPNVFVLSVTATDASANTDTENVTIEVDEDMVIFGAPNNVTGGSTVSTSLWKALLFTTGPDQRRIESIELGLNPPSTGETALNVEIALYTVSAGTPSAQIATTGLTDVFIASTGQMYSFSFSSPVILSPGTSYALVVRSDATGLKWGRYRNFSQAVTSGFSNGGMLGSDNAGASWTDPSSTDNAIILHAPKFVVNVSGSAGFRLMSAPRNGKILKELLGPIWTQGMAGSDVEVGTPNVWTFDDAAENDWVPVSDLDVQEIAPGQGFMVYVFDDTNYDGTPGDLPVALSVSTAGSENTEDVTVSDIDPFEWYLVGNPYAITLDWGKIGKTDISGTVYVYDHAYSFSEPNGADAAASPQGGWRTWNGTAGSLANGHIAPYQGFFVQGAESGPSKSLASQVPSGGELTMSLSDTVWAEGTFYKSSGSDGSAQSLSGSLSLELVVASTSGSGLRDEAFLSFNAEGMPGPDKYDALKLMPFSVDERPLLLLEGESDGERPAPTWSIANLPWSGEGFVGQGFDASQLVVPLQAMHLKADPAKGNVPVAAAATLRWNAEALPAHVRVDLRDRRTGVLTPLEGQGEIAVQTSEGSPIERATGEGTPSYRTRDDAAFELVVRYEATAVSTEDGAGVGGPGGELPDRLILAQNHPNPFNPATQIRFALPQASQRVTLAVHDLLGRRVATLLDGASLGAGWHEVSFDASRLPSGVYTYTLSIASDRTAFSGAVTLSRSLTLIK